MDPLWQALATMRIGPEASGFTTRLAHENGWSLAYAEAVDREYRRFLYLTAKSDGALSPSDEVDQAWHLHLLHSRHYWDVLCAGILGRPLHHDPAAAAEAETTRRQYETTLVRYRATFDETPPPAIWPVRIGEEGKRPLRIDAARYWLIPKMGVGRAASLGGGALLVGACSALVANASARGGGSHAGGVVAAILFVGLLALLCRLLIAGGGKGKGGGNGNCSTFGGSCGGGSSGNHGGHSCGSGCSGSGSGCSGGCGGH